MGSGYPEQELSYQALERLIAVLARARRGDFDVRMTWTHDGMEHDVADAVNEVLAGQAEVTKELVRLAECVGHGDFQARTQSDKAVGGFAQQLRAADELATAFGRHVTELRRVVKAVHAGDLSCRVPVGPDAAHGAGILLQTAQELNALIAHLDAFTGDFQRVLGQLGAEGVLSARCQVIDAGGSWGLLATSLNTMASALSEQVRDLATTTEAIAAGDLSARTWVNGRGDLQQLKSGVNGAAEAMAALCGELRRVAREITIEGKLDVELHQAEPRGEWQTVQDACNGAMARVASTIRGAGQAVGHLLEGRHALELNTQTPGELGVPAQQLVRLAAQEERTQKALETLLHGRFHELKPGASPRDSALFMLGIRLKHEWFGAARAGIVEARERHPGGRDFAQAALTCLAHTSGATAAAYYSLEDEDSLVQVATLGGEGENGASFSVRVGQGLVGKAALDKKPLLLEKLEGTNVRIRTGLLEIVPRALVYFPVVYYSKLLAVIELVFVNEGATTAVELLDYLNADLCSAANASRNKPALGHDTRELQEELVIANARLEQLSADRLQREKYLRELEQSVRDLREQLEHRARAASAAP